MDNPGICRKRDAAIKWFTEFQVDCVMRNGVIPEWFHGIITRKTVDCCRHFMIDVLRNGQYTIVGEATSYSSLDQLVDFHQRIPILPYNEILTAPCGQISDDKPEHLPWKSLSKRSQSTEAIFKEAPPLPPRTFLPPSRVQEPPPAKRTFPTEIPLTHSTATEREASKAPCSGIFSSERLCKVKNVIKEMEKEFRTQRATINLLGLKKNSLKKKGGAAETPGHSEPFQAKSAESWPDKTSDFNSGFQGNSKEAKNIDKDSGKKQPALPLEYRQPPPFAPGYY
ncbi:UNVERIFIED_CONTAM: hypothetical protein FKN15_057756 [Acipenser sinensis]